MPRSPDTFTQAHAILAGAQEKIDRLRNLQPYLIDLSLRENPVGARIGQTLADKLAILPRLREFGFRNILLGTLDYAMPDELEVDDDFMMYLRDHQLDMNGCFAFTDIGIAAADGTFTPSPSQRKLQAYGVPNTLHEIYLSKAGMAGQYDLATLRRSLPASIAWLNANIRGDDGGQPRILINIVDGCDAFAEDPDTACSILSLLADQAIEGISIEDDRGTYLPFQVGAFVAAARSFLPPPLKLLVHMHAGGGFENASVIEALLNGADGAWGGLPKRAAIIGHASLGELIANLVRVGNPHMQASYRLDQLLQLATRLQVLDEEEPVPDDLPILGNNAYRLPLSFFRQQAGRFMDLPPEAIGGAYRYRICPVVSDAAVIAGRLAEVTGQAAESFPEAVLNRMIRLMRRDLRAGKRIAYDEPVQLMQLFARAS
ncbi:homocitrate synthase [Thiobacillus sp.]|uniref:homocitrate synthase n=1 Tax=Thiobacillus sp. TaxID=924 RepID=UPI0018122062|nr:homocitrate synthase [Thiobacillus sp.]MBC2730484.1 homocitrate synthase [Thiobacillus sp.]MBC2739221.1 homocitrate synthase [Thiobacillus sp.]MBC2760494.1 homocitrate synthase [Thiobacillus sp.]